MTFWEIAFDGWFGAVLGSAVSIGVAVFVLRRTLAADRQQFVEQLESERALSLEQRRLEAFGDVAAAMRSMQLVQLQEQVPETFGALAIAASRWRMYLASPHNGVGQALEGVCMSILRCAGRATHTGDSKWSVRMTEAIVGTLAEGARWHRGEISDEQLVRAWNRYERDAVAGMPDLPDMN